MKGKKGFFIVLDGIDGSGKTLQSKMLLNKLCNKEIPVKYTAEPSDGIIGDYIKKLVNSNVKLSPFSETLLFAADRYDHLHNVILKYLNKGYIVICDRYVYSSFAYQGAQGVDLNWLKEVNNFILKPDISIYLDVDPITGLSRIGEKRSLFENIILEQKAREIYLELVKEGEMVYIDSRRDVNLVEKEVLDLVSKKIKLRK